MLSGRVMAIVSVFKDVLKLICGHALQSGESIDEKQGFYE